MSFEPYHHCLLRHTKDEVRIATIWYDISTRNPKYDELVSEKGFFAAITRALTKWVKETESGKNAWQASGEDFNIGDLVNEVGSKIGEQVLDDDSDERELWRYFADEGLHHIEIDIAGDEGVAQHYTYDSVLVDAAELDDE